MNAAAIALDADPESEPRESCREHAERREDEAAMPLGPVLGKQHDASDDHEDPSGKA
jgi:hypothetical protein